MEGVEGCGRLWEGVDMCGHVWTGDDGCGRVWNMVERCGRMWEEKNFRIASSKDPSPASRKGTPERDRPHAKKPTHGDYPRKGKREGDGPTSSRAASQPSSRLGSGARDG